LEAGDEGRFATFSSKVEGAQRGEIVLLQEGELWVLASDSAQRRRGTVERVDAVFFDNAPEAAGVGGTNWLSFVEHGGSTHEQWRVHNEGVADNPANVGGTEDGIPLLNPE